MPGGTESVTRLDHVPSTASSSRSTLTSTTSTRFLYQLLGIRACPSGPSRSNCSRTSLRLKYATGVIHVMSYGLSENRSCSSGTLVSSDSRMASKNWPAPMSYGAATVGTW